MVNLSSPVIALRTSDPEILAATVRNANIEACQLSDRPAPSQLARVVCPHAFLDLATNGPAMLFSGAMPRDCFTLAFANVCPGKGHSFNFGAEHNDGYMGFFPPGGAIDATTPAGFAGAILTIPAADFHSAISTAFPDIPEAILARGAGMRIGPAEKAGLRALLAAVDKAIWQPGNGLSSVLARRHLERDLLEAFFAALRSGCSDLVPSATSRVAGRQRHLCQVRDYIDANAVDPIDLDDLCVSTGLSHRSVGYLFRDMLGLSPMVYLRHRRLHSARRMLREAAPGFGVVKQVAYDCGFWHLGHFAERYRTLFGENPSETLGQHNGLHHEMVTV